MGFGGNNGFTDFKELLGMPLNTPNARAMLFYASLASLLGAYWLCTRVTRSKLGRVLVAVRDAESRVRFLGYDTTRIKLFVFVLSAVLAGLAGALYVPQVGIINPGEFSPGNSIEAVVWVAVGGRGTLVGAVLGAFSVNALKTWLTSVAPDLWLFALGGLFVAVTLFLPRGLVGLLRGASLERAGPLPRRRSVVFDGFRALNSLSSVVEPGELRAVIGPNGAGKTTMMDVITARPAPPPATCGSATTTSRGWTRPPSPPSASAASSRSHRVRRPDGVREPGTALKAPRGPSPACAGRSPARPAADRRRCWTRPGLASRAQDRAAILSTASGNGWRSGCC
jgi:hypothetical protein